MIGRTLSKFPWPLLICLLVLSGCVAGERAIVSGKQLQEQGHYDAALARFQEAVAKNPNRQEYRVLLSNARARAAWAHLEQGREELAKDQMPQAMGEFRIALGIDPTLQEAQQSLARAETRLKAERLIAEAEDFFRQRRFPQAKQNLEEALTLVPGDSRAQALLDKVRDVRSTVMDGYDLEVASDKPITIKFKDARIRDVFTILSKLSGINFIFDEDLKDQNVTVFLEKATFAQTLELLLKMNDLGRRVLNPKTIIIYSNTKDKDKQYQDQVIQTFYLSNIDAKKAVNLLRTMLQLRKIYVHEELNALVIRDNPEVIRLAQQILEAADRPDAEVVYDIELVEIGHNNTLNFGPKLSSYSISAGVSKEGSGTIVGSSLSPGGSTAGLIANLSNLDTFYTLPTATFDFAKTLSDSEILANPKIRVKNKEKAKVHIGTREPVITVTTTGTDTATDNIQYVDVGVKVEVEAHVQLDNSILTKLSLEVSNAERLTPTKNGSIPLRITTTNAQTSLNLKDGETTVIGGLIRNDDSAGKSSIPFLGDIPLLGSLLTSHTNNKIKREILMSITPHIVKSIDLPRSDVASIWSGSEDELKAGQNFKAFAESFVAPADKPAAAPVPARVPPTPLTAVPGQPETVPSAFVPVPASAPEGVPSAPEQTPPGRIENTSQAPQTIPTPVETEVVPQIDLPPLKDSSPPGIMRVFPVGPTLATVGEEFEVEVAADGVEMLYSAPLFVTYPPNLLEFVRVKEGEFLGRDGQTTIFTVSNNRDLGQLIIGTKQGPGGTGVSGGGILAQVTFKALAPGAGSVTLDRVNFRNPAGGRLPVSPGTLAIEVH